MGKIEIEVTKMRWIRKPLIRTSTVDLDDDFGGYLHIDKKSHVDVKVSQPSPTPNGEQKANRSERGE